MPFDPSMDTIELDLDECGDGKIAFKLVRLFFGLSMLAIVEIDLNLLVLNADTKTFLDQQFAPIWETFDQQMSEMAA